MKRLTIRAVAILAAGTAFGLVANAMHPMRLPLVLGDIEGPGIPRWVWERVTIVTPDEARPLLDDGTTVFIDARKPEDHEAGTVPGSVLVPFFGYGEYLPSFTEAHPKGERYLIYCYGSHCGLAMRLAKVMLVDGYEDLWIMHGGIAEWESAGYEVAAP